MGFTKTKKKIMRTFSQEEFDDKENPDIYIEIIAAIYTGQQLQLPEVWAFEVLTPERLLQFKMAKTEWPEFLDNAIQFFIAREEYEICETCKEIKKLL